MRCCTVLLQLVLLLQISCSGITAAANARAFITLPFGRHLQHRHLLEAAASPTVVGSGQKDDVCAKWGLKPRASPTPPRVFDFFIASHELDLMEVRLEELHSVVDHIFVVESRQTFRGKPKPLAFPHVLPRLRAPVIAKVTYTVLDTLQGNDPWERERYQRGQMVNASLASAGITVDPQDVFIMSDLDEIPKPQFVRAMKQCKLTYPIALDSTNHYYSLNYDGGLWDMGPNAMQAAQHADMNAQQLRSAVQWKNVSGLTISHFSNAAWHCSFCFSHASAFLTKLSSFAHSEFDSAHYRNVSRIVQCLKEGWSIFENVGAHGAQPQYRRLPSERVDAPQVVHDNPARFGYLLDRSGDTAGLADVEVVGGSYRLKQGESRMLHHRRPTNGRRQ